MTGGGRRGGRERGQAGERFQSGERKEGTERRREDEWRRDVRQLLGILPPSARPLQS